MVEPRDSSCLHSMIAINLTLCVICRAFSIYAFSLHTVFVSSIFYMVVIHQKTRLLWVFRATKWLFCIKMFVEKVTSSFWKMLWNFVHIINIKCIWNFHATVHWRQSYVPLELCVAGLLKPFSSKFSVDRTCQCNIYFRTNRNNHSPLSRNLSSSSLFGILTFIPSVVITHGNSSRLGQL